MNTYMVKDNDSKESGMNYSNTKARTIHIIVASVLTLVGAVGTYGIANAATCATCHAPVSQTPADIRPVDGAFRNITTGGFKGSHAKHLPSATVNQSDCTVCHGPAVTSYTTSHRNGFIHLTSAASVGYTKGTSFAQSGAKPATLGKCNNASCHDSGKGVFVQTPTWGTVSDACTVCHALVPGDSHTQHVTATQYHKAVCADCHTGYVSGTSAGANHLNGSVNVNSGMGYSTSKAKGSAFESCTSTYCHSSGQSANGLSATPDNYASVTWGGSAACGSCHAVVSPDFATGSHTKHLASNTDCSKCHTGATSAAYNATTHVDGSIDVASGLSYTAGGTPGNGYGTCATNSCHNDGTTGTQTDTPTWGTAGTACATCHAAVPTTGKHDKHLTSTGFHKAVCGDCHDGAVAGTSGGTSHLDGNVDVAVGGYPTNIAKHAAGTYSGTCSSVYCHSSGQSANGLSSTPVYVSVTWGGTAACGSCHATTAMSTGSHPKHMTTGIKNSTNCGNCHANATATLYNYTSHINGKIDVTSGLGYSASGAPGNGYSNCTNAVSCHNDGTGTVAATPVWGTATSACTACHALTPTTGSHTKHLSGLSVISRNAACSDCHTGYTQGNTAAANHLNGTIEVNVGGYTSPKTPGSAVSSCSITSCHSSKSATWGGTSTGCGFCHDAFPTSGSHSIHIAGGSNYSFGCAECHGHNGAGTSHANGTLEISASIGYNGSKICATSDCHSDGKASLTYMPSPAWGGSFTGDRCAACHGNWPTGDAHSAHAVGIHYNDIGTGSIGKIAATGAAGINAAHGNPLYSTTISCNICHASTVTASYNDSASTCSTAGCHGAGGVSHGVLATANVNKTFHVNRARDVVFANMTFHSKAQIRNDITTVPSLDNNWSRTNGYKTGASSHDKSKLSLSASGAEFAGGSCSAVACHNGIIVSWTAGSMTCDKCHTSVP